MRLLDRLRQQEPQVERAMVLTQPWAAPGKEYVAPDFISWSDQGYGGNAVVFAVLNARLNLFTEATFKFRDLATKRLFGTPDLSLLERPWPNGTTGDLLARMEQDVFLGGNAFVRVAGDRLERLRPDRVTIAHVIDSVTGADEVIGYAYKRDSLDEEFYPVQEVAHWSPIPDPLNRFRGMAVLTPIVRDVNNDLAMTEHKSQFFANAATPNVVVKYPVELTAESIGRIRDRFNARYGGPTGEKTLVLDRGADMTVVGSSFEQMAFTAVQSAGEARISAAASVPPIVAGLQAGLDAATYSNYREAFRAFGSGFMRSHWRSACAALEPIVNVPTGAQLWFDVSDIAALQEAEAQRAEAAATRATAMSTLIMAGYSPDTVTAAVIADDYSLLSHTGALSVQLYPEGKAPTNG